jgi:hypothetical protein
MKLNLVHVVLVMLLCIVGVWWWSTRDARVPSSATTAEYDCPLPPRVTVGDAPLQSEVPSSLQSFTLNGSVLKPLAGFSVDARVLSREDYSLDRGAKLSPTDLALGWQRMDDDAVLSRLSISQSGRWYQYRWQNQPPLPPDEIVRSSANMHMIPASATVARTLASVRVGEHVRIDGWLIEATFPDGGRWRSSLTRDDTGNGACELVYVCAIERR